MTFIDFHTHLDCYENKKELSDWLKTFNGRIVSASMDLDSYFENIKISERAKKISPKLKIIPTLGIHPKNAEKESPDFSKYKPYLSDSPLIGEIGLDFCWHKDVPLLFQEKAFRFFLGHCEESKKYCVIHTKDAEEKTARILEDYPNARPIIHWYDGPKDIYQEFIKRKYLETFGCQTIRSGHIQELLKITPKELILAETDNPDSEIWLGGSEKSPHLIKRIYSDIAEILNISTEETAGIINKNANKILTVQHF
ncbi:MAG: TatD family hydrolase [Treponema sp.]|nr:TatD family hydrolase [Treponema sp.]